MDADLLLFSKDRAAQADQLLRSLDMHVHLPKRVHVLYGTSSADHASGYEQLFREHPGVEAIAERETDVDTALRAVVESSTARLFGMLVDDDVMIRPVTAGDEPLRKLASDARVACVSLRLAPHKTHSQTHARPMQVPAIHDGIFDVAPALPRQRKRHGRIVRLLRRMRRRPKPHHGCWGVPFSADGNLYLREPFRAFCRRVPRLAHVTEVEPTLTKHAAAWGAPLWCAIYPEERLMNLVMNNVDGRGARYPHPGHSPDEANARYLAGERLDFRAYEGGRFDACHVEVEPRFTAID